MFMWSVGPLFVCIQHRPVGLSPARRSAAAAAAAAATARSAAESSEVRDGWNYLESQWPIVMGTFNQVWATLWHICLSF